MLKISSPSAAAWERGFTLAELMVVIGIIAIVSTMGGIYMADYIRKSRLQEAAREVDADISVVRNAARMRQVGNIVVTFITGTGVQNGLLAFVDANNSRAYEAGEETLVNRSLSGAVLLGVTSTGTPVAPVTTVEFTALGGLRDADRWIRVSTPSEPKRQFMITIFQTGITRVQRSEDAGATWPTRAW